MDTSNDKGGPAIAPHLADIFLIQARNSRDRTPAPVRSAAAREVLFGGRLTTSSARLVTERPPPGQPSGSEMDFATRIGQYWRN
ncbi:hypothetical protein CVV68_10565 [Arthrobacter livingstonensis]|uniref:Uncharacterized protein n=1 Tax=Arthrobacter livingstonensis TaxID=670078 RepID=A0A2V5L9S2_9MICC|nr:hypothetical protein CVV68_10565 [Arthrobacter livingstonensis]